MSKQNLPNSVTGGLNYVGEKQKYNSLYEASSRTQSGQISWTSSTSNITYNTANYSSDATIYNKGEEGLLQLLKNILSDYLLVANDINSKSDIIYVDSKFGNLSNLTTTNKTDVVNAINETYNFASKAGVTDQYYITTSTTGNIGALGEAGTKYVVTTGKGITPNNGARVTFKANINSTQILNYTMPTMTSNNTPTPYIASANGENSPAWKAFNNNSSDYWTSSTTTTGWLQFYIGQPIKLNTYSISVITTSSTGNPKTWTLQGSNDGTNWTIIDTVSTYTFASTTDTFVVDNNTTAFMYYRLNITATNSTGYNPTVCEFKLLTYIMDNYTLNVDNTGDKPLICPQGIMANKTYDARYESSIDSFIATTQEEKLVANYTLPSAASSFTISGLDINRDGGMYEIQISNLVSSVGFAMNIFINGDTTTTNYYYVDALGYLNNPINSAPCITAYTTPGNGHLDMNINGNRVLGNVYPCMHYVSTGGNAMRSVQDVYLWEHKNTQTNITSITFSVASGTINSATVKIYKR